MARPSLKHVALLALATASLSACGSQGVDLDSADSGNAQINRGAQLFSDRCSGCHTIDSAGAQGSATKVRDRETTDGPNFNQRREDKESILYAIRNGGFSGAIMPENIVVGDDARKVAEYLSKYAGRDAEKPVSPQSGGETP